MTRLSRRLDLPLPKPLMQRWSHASTDDDESFQDLVLRHLGIQGQVISMPPNAIEVLGPWSRQALLRQGISWPWRVHTRQTMLEAAVGGVLVDGEGGDELFGPTRTRVLLNLRQGRTAPHALAVQLVRDLGPWRLRSRSMRSRGDEYPWFTLDGLREIWWPVLESAARVPLAARSAIHHAANDPVSLFGHRAIREHHARHGVTAVSPLLDASFVEALAREAGLLGWRDRTTAMSRLFGDVLPGQVLRRSSKVDFTEIAWGEETREWLAGWDRSSGIEPRWVRPKALAAEWASSHPHPATALMAQAAWLEQEVGRDPFA